MRGRRESSNAAPDEPSPGAAATHSRRPPRVAGAIARLETMDGSAPSTPYLPGLAANAGLYEHGLFSVAPRREVPALAADLVAAQIFIDVEICEDHEDETTNRKDPKGQGQRCSLGSRSHRSRSSSPVLAPAPPKRNQAGKGRAAGKNLPRSRSPAGPKAGDSPGKGGKGKANRRR